MVRTWWHKLFSQGQWGVQRGARRARVRQRLRQKPLLQSLEDRCLLSYSVTDLGILPGATASFARGINNSGQVAGVSEAVDDYDNVSDEAFLWDATNGMQGLGFLRGGHDSVASGINDSGQVVGTSDDFGPFRAFLWDTVNGMRDLRTLLDYTSSEASGINNSGQVVGVAFGGGINSPHAFLWDVVNGMQDLGTLPGYTSSSAYGINNSAQVVGESYTSVSASGHAFLWDAVNGMQDLGTLPGDGVSRAFGINDSGQVVGDSLTDFFGPHHAFLWDAVNGMQDLGTLPGGNSSEAFGINNNGQVVGLASTGSAFHAFLWQNGTLSDLNDLIPPGSGWTLASAGAINSAGQIVGYGTVNGQTHAYLLTPDSSALTGPAGRGHFTRSDAQAVLLADSTVTAAGAGVPTFSLTPATRGEQTLTGTDPAEATRLGRTTVPLTSNAAASAGRTVPNATDALFARSHRANAAVAASDGEVNALELGVSLLPEL